MTHEEHLVPRFHFELVGHGWRREIVGVGRLRQRDRERRRESSGPSHGHDATSGPIFWCIAILHMIVLWRFVFVALPMMRSARRLFPRFQPSGGTEMLKQRIRTSSDSGARRRPRAALKPPRDVGHG